MKQENISKIESFQNRNSNLKNFFSSYEHHQEELPTTKKPKEHMSEPNESRSGDEVLFSFALRSIC